ncbi:DUF6049 family protein [Streptomyces sp. NBC_01803]|uniref:DUF6049 family protein n=1 Tax=Streptomyces sp. NBC_01803 TaxID=2975946 RepID=UPI002DD9FDBF|nr:DUF6049 family protein [Streptomyces sp. NBC_01803]WSA45282.1 DUF6049 family protein [Streptomyces sp. NBC_01803]
MDSRERGWRVAVSGMRVRGARRLASLLAAVIALPLLTGLAPLPSASAGAPGEELGTGHRRATISITDLGPAVPGEDDTLTIRGTITNEGDSPIIDSSVAARQGVPLSSRSAIDQAMARTGFDYDTDGLIVRGHGQDIGTIQPGMSATFSLRVPVSELALGEPGVYQLGVGLTGQTEAERWGDQVLGLGRTLLPWQPDPGAQSPQTRLTVLWPLVSTTHLTSRTDADEEQTPAFRNDDLLREISPGGRLYQLVSLGADLPVTWVIDPDLLASVDAMREEHLVETDTGLVPGTGQEEALAWLLMLEEAVRQDEVIALPFGDPDVASLAHQGMDVHGALSQFATATETSAQTVETVLVDTEPSTDFAWPVDGAIDPSIVSVATSAGATHVITRSDSLRPGDALSYTPTAARPIGGGTTAIVSDARLSTLFEGDLTRTGAAALAQQQLLAQTLAITLEAPANERSVVLAPQRMPTADQAQAMAAAIRGVRDEGDWVAFADLSEAADATPDPAANNRVPSAEEYPAELREQELSTSTFQSMRETQRTLADFLVILTDPDRVNDPFGNAIRREMSTSWRSGEEEVEEYGDSVQEGLVALTERVQLIPKSDITLSGRSATIPVTVQNNLVQDVHNLELRLVSLRQLGLEVSGAQDVRVNGGHSQSFKFTATARANGVMQLSARLYTTEDKAYGEEITFEADVTSITSEVMMVIAGGILLMVLAGIRMYSQRKRAARKSAADATGTDIGSDTGADTDGSGDESRTDTGADVSGAPPGSERLDPNE